MAAIANLYDLTLALPTTSDQIALPTAICIADYLDEITAKRLFYLDSILYAVRKDASGNPVKSFIGGCTPSGENARHHNPNRSSRLASATTASQQVYFNDAGLNTLANITLSTPAELTTHWANYISFQLNTLSAYYCITHMVGYEYYRQGVWHRRVFNQTIAPKVSQSMEVLGEDLGYQPGEAVEIRGVIVNEEGEFKNTLNLLRFTAQEAIEIRDSMRYNAVNDINGYTQEVILKKSDYDRLSQLTNSDTATGIYGYTTPLMGVKIPNGFYKGLVPEKTLKVIGGEFLSWVYRQEQYKTLVIDLYTDQENEADQYAQMIIAANLTNSDGNPTTYTITLSVGYFNRRDNQEEPPSLNMGRIPTDITLTIPAGRMGVDYQSTYMVMVNNPQVLPDGHYWKAYNITVAPYLLVETPKLSI